MDYFDTDLIDNEENPSLFNSSDSSKSSKQMYNKSELNHLKCLSNDIICKPNPEKFKFQLKPISNSCDVTQPQNLETCNSDIFREYEYRQSLSRSNDSGLPYSGSISINSKKNKYHHIQSKVKKYINDIKNQQSQRNPVKSSEICLLPENEHKIDEVDEYHEEINKQILTLKEENEEKDIMIKCLLDQIQEIQENYVTAEKKIQDLRFKLYQAQYQGNLTCRSNKKNITFSPKIQTLSSYKDVTFATLMSNNEKNNHPLPLTVETNSLEVLNDEKKRKTRSKETSQVCETGRKIVPNMIVEPCECWDTKYDVLQSLQNKSQEKYVSTTIPPLYINDENSSVFSTNSNEMTWEDSCEITSNVSELLDNKRRQFINIHSDTYNTSSTSYKSLQLSIFGNKSKNQKKLIDKNSCLIYQRSFINNIQRRNCGQRIRNSLSELFSKHSKLFKQKSSNLLTANNSQYFSEVNLAKQTTKNLNLLKINQVKKMPEAVFLESNKLEKDINLDTALQHAEEMKKMSESLKVFLIMNLKLT